VPAVRKCSNRLRNPNPILLAHCATLPGLPPSSSAPRDGAAVAPPRGDRCAILYSSAASVYYRCNIRGRAPSRKDLSYNLGLPGQRCCPYSIDPNPQERLSSNGQERSLSKEKGFLCDFPRFCLFFLFLYS